MVITNIIVQCSFSCLRSEDEQGYTEKLLISFRVETFRTEAFGSCGDHRG